MKRVAARRAKPSRRLLDVSPKPLTAAMYIRVSSQDQNHDMQGTELRGYAERMGWQVVEYPEKMSAAKRRPALERLMEDARLRRIDIVLVWKLDRFARSLKQLMDNITLLDSYGVRFICMTQGVDTDRQNPAGRLMMQIFGAFAEFERSLIIERVRSGMAEAKRQGRHVGRPAPIWRRDEAFALREKGCSFREIAAKLGRPESSIRRALKSAPKG